MDFLGCSMTGYSHPLVFLKSKIFQEFWFLSVGALHSPFPALIVSEGIVPMRPMVLRSLGCCESLGISAGKILFPGDSLLQESQIYPGAAPNWSRWC